ncbi:MAG: hypothetical protein KKB62_02705 [Nanoarchaeota archaeon]|nr:hypothetical protein [Nanoarchaeota archaeon]
MGMLEYFKKLIKKEETSKIEKEKIQSSEILNWIKNKKNENEIKEKEFFKVIQNKINIFTNQLEKKIDIAEAVDVETKKADNRLKAITNEGRKRYIESLRGFVQNLNDLKKSDFENFTKEIDKTFANFSKFSNKNYERATVLIGKEMADIKREIKSFSTGLIETFDKNKKISEVSNALLLIKENLSKFSEVKKEKEKAEKSFDLTCKKINELENEKKKILEEIEKIKESEEYKKNQEKIKKAEKLKEELKNEILGLEQIIDFKALSNFYHVFEDQMKVVKLYKNNFLEQFQKEGGDKILNLLDEAKMKSKNILEKINQINSKKDEITKLGQEIKEDKTNELNLKVTRTIQEIGDLEGEKSREKKVYEKTDSNKKEFLILIKRGLGKFDLELIP